MARLTDRVVKAAIPGRYGDGDGLHLIVIEIPAVGSGCCAIR